jgi:hypothetical protein
MHVQHVSTVCQSGLFACFVSILHGINVSHVLLEMGQAGSCRAPGWSNLHCVLQRSSAAIDLARVPAGCNSLAGLCKGGAVNVTAQLVLLGHENEHRGVSNSVVRHSIVIACILTCAAEVYDIAATIRVLSLRSTIRIAVYDVRISPFRQSLIGLRSVKSPLARRSVQLV